MSANVAFDPEWGNLPLTLTSTFIVTLVRPTLFNYGCCFRNRNVEFDFLLSGSERLLEDVGRLQSRTTEDGGNNQWRHPQQQPKSNEEEWRLGGVELYFSFTWILSGDGRAWVPLLYLWASALGAYSRSLILGFFLFKAVFGLKGLLHAWLTRPISRMILK